jgi:rhamnogalacturonyl hydrolase YesR
MAMVSNISYIPAKKNSKIFIHLTATTLTLPKGASGDPASVGIAALLIGQTYPEYTAAAERQEAHLINDVPRWPNGAISQREAYAELWADFVYMAPPFLAYYAVATADVDLLKQTAQQCLLYHDVLATDLGPWHHIIGPENQDLGLWSTGNGWAAAGMARVLATMMKSPFAEATKNEQNALIADIKAIIDGAIILDTDSSGLLRNYLNDTTWFGETSGTAMLTATSYRMAVLAPSTFGAKYTNWANKKVQVVDSCINNTTGVVAPAINPLSWGDRTPFTTGSPEGQSFVVLMHAAYRDWSSKGD